MTGALLRNHIRITRHFLATLEPSTRLRLVIVLGLLAFVLGRWAMGLTAEAFNFEGTIEFPGLVRVAGYRIGGFLAAVIGFLSFGAVWRNSDLEVLNRLPVPPRSIFGYRLVMTFVGNLPFLGFAVLGIAPLFWRGHVSLGVEASVYLAVLYVGTSIWSLYWHMFAGYSVVTEGYVKLKTMLAGAMVLPDRTLLLYSPFLGAACGFGMGLSVLTGLSAISRGQLWIGVVLVGLPLYPTLWAYRKARSMFDAWYYQALAALADGEMLGEAGESAPGAGYLGAWYVEKLPVTLRPLVDKDLRQAWRRSRLDHLVLIMATLVLMILAAGRGESLRGSVWFWPVVWVVLSAAAGQAFRLSRSLSDASWQWLTLPVSLFRQYLGRWLGTLFFSLMVGPGVVIAMGWAGVPWMVAIGLWLFVSVGATTVATNLALVFFGQARFGVGIFFGVMTICLIGAGGDPWVAGIGVLVIGLASAGVLRRLPDRLVDAEQAR